MNKSRGCCPITIRAPTSSRDHNQLALVKQRTLERPHSTVTWPVTRQSGPSKSGRSDDTAAPAPTNSSGWDRDRWPRQSCAVVSRPVVASRVGRGLEEGAKLHAGSFPRNWGARRGGSFATASTHASCQCLAITPPPVTRQPGPKGAGGAMTPRPHRCATSSTSRDESSLRGLRGRREPPPGSFPRNGVPGGAAASRQHLRTRPASALPSRRHQ